MGNTTSNSSRIRQEINNNFLSVNSNNCQSTAGVSVDGNVVNIKCLKNCKNVTGINVSGSMNSSCSITQQLSQSASSIIKSQIDQESEVANDLFNDGVIFSANNNSADILQSTVNNIVNINSNVCNSDTELSSSDNVVNIGVGGNANNVTGIQVSPDMSSDCVINNVVNQEAYNDLQGGSKQSAKTLGMIVAITSAVVTMMLIGLIAIVIIFGGGALILGVSKKRGSGQSGGGENYDDYGDDYDDTGEDY